MTLQQIHDDKRRQYLQRDLTHEEFYLWLADSIGTTRADLPVSVDRVRQSKDPYLNDIPLALWDRKDPFIRRKAVRAGMRSWSLSDTVCVLKAFARRELSVS